MGRDEGCGIRQRDLRCRGIGAGLVFPISLGSNIWGFVFMKSVNISQAPCPSLAKQGVLSSGLSYRLRSNLPKSQEGCGPARPARTLVTRCFHDPDLSSFSKEVGFLSSAGS